MAPSPHELLRRIFDLAMAAAPQDRPALLDHECAGNADLRRRVEAMIAAQDHQARHGHQVGHRPL